MSTGYWEFAATIALALFALAVGTTLFLKEDQRGSTIINKAAGIFHDLLRSIRTSAAHHAPRGLLVDLFMPPDRAEDVLYNLLGRYDHWVEIHGSRWARIIFYLQS